MLYKWLGIVWRAIGGPLAPSYSLHFRVWPQTRDWSVPDLTCVLSSLFFKPFVSFSLTAGITWRPAVWTRDWTLGKVTVWTWCVRRALVKTPTRTETRTGTTTANHPGAVVGVVAADEAAAGTETEGGDEATLATGPPRYENLLLPSSSLSCLYHQFEWVIITGV